MPNRSEHNRSSKITDPFHSATFRDKINRCMDSTSNIHPGDRHRKDEVHTLEGVEKRFGTSGLPTAISHLAEDMKSNLRKNKKII
ncbi:MAG: hypothetical protein GF311_09820 [Candidatus Lokiarchaeota archaeon]|nr:hypothetical protein [Candidatus Lokiarchaeota archaeon]